MCCAFLFLKFEQHLPEQFAVLQRSSRYRECCNSETRDCQPRRLDFEHGTIAAQMVCLFSAAKDSAMTMDFAFCGGKSDSVLRE